MFPFFQTIFGVPLKKIIAFLFFRMTEEWQLRTHMTFIIDNLQVKRFLRLESELFFDVFNGLASFRVSRLFFTKPYPPDAFLGYSLGSY